MSCFCKECSLYLFGVDFRDFADIAKEGEMAQVLCEHCGVIWVDKNGVKIPELDTNEEQE